MSDFPVLSPSDEPSPAASVFDARALARAAEATSLSRPHDRSDSVNVSAVDGYDDGVCSLRVARHNGDPPLVVAAGELDAFNAPALETLLRILHSVHPCVHLDLAEISFAGASVLTTLRRAADVEVVATGRSIDRLFEIDRLIRNGVVPPTRLEGADGPDRRRLLRSERTRPTQ